MWSPFLADLLGTENSGNKSFCYSTEPCHTGEIENIESQVAKFMGPTWGPPGSCWPQIGPMLAQWTLLSGIVCMIRYGQIPQSIEPVGMDVWLFASRWHSPCGSVSLAANAFQNYKAVIKSSKHNYRNMHQYLMLRMELESFVSYLHH